MARHRSASFMRDIGFVNCFRSAFNCLFYLVSRSFCCDATKVEFPRWGEVNVKKQNKQDEREILNKLPKLFLL